MTNSRKKFAALICACCTTVSFGQSPYAPNFASIGGGRLSISESQCIWSFGPVQCNVIMYLDGIRDTNRRYYRGETETESNATTMSTAVNFAQDRFYEKGGKYSYGPNDCSTFVCDFLGQFTTTIPRRFTTATLFDGGFMNEHGFVPVDDIYSDAQEYDVIVYRYFDADFGSEGGHCGVIVWKDGKLCVEHNSSSKKGLAWTPIDDFYRHMADMPEVRGPRLYRWAGALIPGAPTVAKPSGR